jgi:hypothetical protein
MYTYPSRFLFLNTWLIDFPNDQMYSVIRCREEFRIKQKMMIVVGVLFFGIDG